MVPAADRARAEFAAQAFMRTLGAELTLVGPGALTVELTIHQPLTQQHGFLHAGALTSVLDTACGMAAVTTVPAGKTVETANLNVSLLHPATGTKVVVNADVLESGPTLVVSEATATMVSGDGHEVVCAIMTATGAVVDAPRGVALT